MENKLFLIPRYGPDLMLRNRLVRENIDIEWIDFYDSKENQKLYKKFDVKLTPVLLKVDKKTVCDRIFGVEDIIKELKKIKENVQN